VQSEKKKPKNINQWFPGACNRSPDFHLELILTSNKVVINN